MSEKMKHTPEPWSIEEGTEIGNADFWLASTDLDLDADKANAARIVSCVNACAGIENPEEFRKRFDEMVRVLEIARTKLNKAGDALSESSKGCEYYEAAEYCFAAIKAAKGE